MPITLLVVVRCTEAKLISEIILYPIGHFGIHLGENFEKSVSDQLDFFKEHLL